MRSELKRILDYKIKSLENNDKKQILLQEEIIFYAGQVESFSDLEYGEALEYIQVKGDRK